MDEDDDGEASSEVVISSEGQISLLSPVSSANSGGEPDLEESLPRSHNESAAPKGFLKPYWDLLRSNRNYRLLFVANIVSELGNWFSLVATWSILQSAWGSTMAVAVNSVRPPTTTPHFLYPRIWYRWVLSIDRFSRSSPHSSLELWWVCWSTTRTSGGP